MHTNDLIKSRGIRILPALVVAILGWNAHVAHAGLFDWKSSSKKPAAASSRKTETSPIRQVSATEPVPEPMEIAPYGVEQDGECLEPAMKVKGEKQFRCFNCGEEDKCLECNRHCRKKCGQTWYPRVAPYCESGWGYTQPCWRRTQDNYNCPRPTVPNSPAPPPAPPARPERAKPPTVSEPLIDGIPEPDENPVPELPPVPRESRR